MLHRLRTAPLAHAAVLAAAVLAFVSSAGLHPEPIGAENVSAHRGLASAHTDEAAHACPACRTHAAAFVVAPLGLLSTATAPTSLGFSVDSPFVDRLAGRDLSGRSPPSRS